MPDTHTARTDAERLIQVLDAAETTPDAATLRARSYQLLRLQRGATVVDAGFHDVEIEVHAAIFADAASQPLLARHADAVVAVAPSAWSRPRRG
ncbi:hypothetical protein [Micromonospora sp. NPDC023737]|uniref:hypothetical protein n=1 Tax=unclassified Micromonospora TaxID=2617518 RepID=UPI0033C31898